MAATVIAPKDARLDMRMTQAQRREIERAASAKGMSLTQWALGSLLDAARRDIQNEATTRLSERDFDALQQALEAGMPDEALLLLERKAVWE